MIEYLAKNNDAIHIDTTLKVLENYDKKNMELNLYEITEKILNKYHTLDETYSYFSLDKTMVGLYMYENFPNFIFLKCLELDIANKDSPSLSDGVKPYLLSPNGKL